LCRCMSLYSLKGSSWLPFCLVLFAHSHCPSDLSFLPVSRLLRPGLFLEPRRFLSCCSPFHFPPHADLGSSSLISPPFQLSIPSAPVPLFLTDFHASFLFSNNYEYPWLFPHRRLLLVSSTVFFTSSPRLYYLTRFFSPALLFPPCATRGIRSLVLFVMPAPFFSILSVVVWLFFFLLVFFNGRGAWFLLTPNFSPLSVRFVFWRPISPLASGFFCRVLLFLSCFLLFVSSHLRYGVLHPPSFVLSSWFGCFSVNRAFH